MQPQPQPDDTAAKLAALIRQNYPDEQQPAELATQLVAVAEAHGINTVGLVMWLTDRPRHELSSTHLLTWCDRFGLKKGAPK